jgi:hypothetical protein
MVFWAIWLWRRPERTRDSRRCRSQRCDRRWAQSRLFYKI